MDAQLRRLAIFCILLLLGSCAWPRIIILEDPLTPEEHLNLGVAYEKNNEFDQAIKEYRSAAGKLAIASLYLGNVYFQRKEFDKAAKYYQEAIRREPSQADAYNNLAWLSCVQGKDLGQAEKMALKAMELRPEKVGIYTDTLNKIRERRQKRSGYFHKDPP